MKLSHKSWEKSDWLAEKRFEPHNNNNNNNNNNNDNANDNDNNNNLNNKRFLWRI